MSRRTDRTKRRNTMKRKNTMKRRNNMKRRSFNRLRKYNGGGKCDQDPGDWCEARSHSSTDEQRCVEQHRKDCSKNKK